MKKLILPLAIALICGIAGGTGLTVLRTPKASPIDSAKVGSAATAVAGAASDTAALTEADSAHDDGTAVATKDSLMTPAESLRAVVASRASRSGLAAQTTTRGLRDAVADSAKSVADAAPAKPVAGIDKPNASTTAASAGEKPGTASLTDAVDAVRNARNSALATALPEERLAKIFSAMQAKDAARVLDQMEDRDIRAVISLMGDRQVAAILSALPAPRAASITRGATKASGADK